MLSLDKMVEDKNQRMRRYMAGYRKRNPETMRASLRRRNQRVKLKVLDAYGCKCAQCEETNPNRLTLDHINDDGNEHRRRLGKNGATGTTLYRDVHRRGCPPGEVQVLCWNHNLAKLRRALKVGTTPAARSNQRLRDLVISAYGGKCALCSCADREMLVLDHVNGGGVQERKATQSSKPFRDARDSGFSSNYRVLCANCNGEQGLKLPDPRSPSPLHHLPDTPPAPQQTPTLGLVVS